MNNQIHGKYTIYTSSGSILNEVYRKNSEIASKSVKQDEAYYSRTGAPMRAKDNWKSLTVLKRGESWDPDTKQKCSIF